MESPAKKMPSTQVHLSEKFNQVVVVTPEKPMLHVKGTNQKSKTNFNSNQATQRRAISKV